MILQADNNMISHCINMLDFYECDEILCNKNLILANIISQNVVNSLNFATNRVTSAT